MPKPQRPSQPSAHPLRDAANALCRAAIESCHQHDRLAHLFKQGGDETELRLASEMAGLCDAQLTERTTSYEDVAAIGRGTESEAWWHAANALWAASREYGRRIAAGDGIASKMKKHTPEQLGEIQVASELEYSARMSLKKAVEDYQKAG